MNVTASPSVLIVDDETGILETLKILLKNEGFTPHVALGGKQGLEQIAALGVEVIRPDLPLELVARRGPVGRLVVCCRSPGRRRRGIAGHRPT